MKTRTAILGLLLSLVPVAQASHIYIGGPAGDVVETAEEELGDTGPVVKVPSCVRGNDWHYCGGVLRGSCTLWYDFNSTHIRHAECFQVTI